MRRDLFVRELVHNGVVKVIQVPTADNIADLMTKVLDKGKFDTFTRAVLGVQKGISGALSFFSLSFLGVLDAALESHIALAFYGDGAI